VKVITQGQVTLMGNARREKQAQRPRLSAAGSSHVKNEITIAPARNPRRGNRASL
jgi:hypothetical protein